MIVLGLGSNIGNSLAHLRNAFAAIKNLAPLISIQSVSPIYQSTALLPNDAPTDWQQHYLNCALLIKTQLTPIGLLEQVKMLEQHLGRAIKQPRWSPRVIDIDILAFENLVINETALSLPHPGLLERPFALFPLTDVAPHWHHPVKHQTAIELSGQWQSRFDGTAPFHTQQINQRIDAPQLVGILNVTPDSFSDGGDYMNLEIATQHVLSMVNEGADIIDVGAESTAPTSKIITQLEEMRRLKPVLEMLQQLKKTIALPFKISVDTYHPDVAAFALAMGADWINDVTGLENLDMQNIVREANATAVFMHHLSIPARRDIFLPREINIIGHLQQFAEKRLRELVANGLSPDKLIFDPGIGFGKTAEQSLALLAQCQQFSNLGVAVLIGHSRKRFHAAFTNHQRKDSDLETIIISTIIAQKSVDYLRVHQIAGHSRALHTLKALTNITNSSEGTTN